MNEIELLLTKDLSLVKLGELTTLCNEQAKEELHEIMSITKSKGVVLSKEYFAKRIASEDTSKYKKLYPGYFAYSTIHIDEGAIGINTFPYTGIVSPLYTLFQCDAMRIIPYYLLILLKSEMLLAKYRSIGTGSIDRRCSVPYNAFSRIAISLPSLQEQQRIVHLLQSLDTLIETNDQYIAQLEQVKKGLLQKELNPEELPDGWEEKSISEIAQTNSGGTPSTSNKDFYTGDIPWITITDLNDGQVIKTRQQITSEAVKRSSAKWIPAKSVLFAMYGASIGKMGMNVYAATTNQAICTLVPNTFICKSRFLWYSLLSHRENIIAKGFGGAQKNISQAFVKTYKIALPPLQEQQRIVKLLQSVDDNIEAHKEKSESLRELKKGLMSDLLSGKHRIPDTYPIEEFAVE